MSEGRLIAKNVSVLTIAQAVSMLAGLGTMMVLTRILGPEHFGYLGFGMAILAYFHMTATFGSDTYGIREISRARDQAGPIAGGILGPRLIMAALSFAVLLALVYFFDMSQVFELDNSQAFKAVVLIQGLTIFSVALSLDYVFAGLERMEINALRQSAQSLLVFVGVGFLVREPDDVVLAAVVQTGMALAVTLGLVLYARSSTPGISPSLRKVGHVVKASAPFAVSTMMVTVYFTFDIIMLGSMRSLTEAGLYSGAYRVVVLSLVPAGIIYAVLYPRLSLSMGDKERMRKDVRWITAALLFVGIPIAIVGMVCSDQIVKILMGPKFLHAAGPLFLMMANVLVIYLRMSMEASLTAWDMEKFHSKVTVAGGVLNVGLNFLLIPEYGMMGAAGASLVCQLIITGLFAIGQYRTVGQVPGLTVIKGLCAGALAYVAGSLALDFILGVHPIKALAFAGGITGLVFVAAALGLRLIRPKEIQAALRRT